jgi:hypothetical protein
MRNAQPELRATTQHNRKERVITKTSGCCGLAAADHYAYGWVWFVQPTDVGRHLRGISLVAIASTAQKFRLRREQLD